MLSKFRFHISHRVAVEAVHDLVLFIGAFVATGVLDQPGVSKQALVAAAVTALRVTLRGLLPAPVEKALGDVLGRVLHAGATTGVPVTVTLNPPPTPAVVPPAPGPVPPAAP